MTVSMFEVFFDLVFVFALTRVVGLMESDPDPESIVRGVLVLSLLWWAWCAFIWLGNAVPLGRRPAIGGSLVAMGALFVAALVIPFSWETGQGGFPFAVVLACAFAAVRASYVVTFIVVARGDRRQRTQILIDAVPQTVSCCLLVVGALLGGTAQTILWACAFAVDFGAGRVLSGYNGWRVGNPGHFSERHGLVLIIALGETLLSAGSGFDSRSDPLVIVDAVMGLGLAVALWVSFFDRLAGAAAEAMTAATPARRPALARDGYTLAQFPLILGVVLTALGLNLLFRDVISMPAEPARTVGLVALVGGVGIYFAGLGVFQRVMLGTVPATPVVGAVLIVVVGAAASGAPASLLLALVTTTSIAVSSGMRRSRSPRRPVYHP